MKPTTIIILGALLLACLAFVAGCGRKPPGEVEPPPPEPPRKLIGVLLSLSGPDKSDGEALLSGLKLALRKKGATVGFVTNSGRNSVDRHAVCRQYPGLVAGSRASTKHQCVSPRVK